MRHLRLGSHGKIKEVYFRLSMHAVLTISNLMSRI